MKIQTKSSAQNIVKCLLITSVVFFHASMFLVANPAEVMSQFNILLTLFPFLMMVFFFYAGYNYTPGKRSVGQNIKRRTFQLLIPMVITLVVSCGIIFAIKLPAASDKVIEAEKLTNSICYSLMSEPLALMIGYPANGLLSFDMDLALGILWFLYALYVCSIFFYLIVDYEIKKPSRLLSIIFILLIGAFCMGQFAGVYLPYTVQCYPVALAMMLLAAYLKQFNFLDKKVESKKELLFLIINTVVAELVVVGIGLFGYFYYGSTMVGSLPGGMFDSNIKGFDAFVSFIMGFLGTFVVHQLSRLIMKVPVLSTVFDWYGRHSSYVYLSHPLFLSFIHTIIFQEQTKVGGFQPYLYVFMTIAMLVVIFLFVDWIIVIIKNKKHPVEAAS